MAADRTVRVKLAVTGIREYTRDLATATAATELLRRETERLDGKRLRLKADVDATSAIGQLRGLDRSATRAEGSIRRMRGQLGSLRRYKVPAIAVGAVASTPAVAGATADVRRLLGVIGLVPAAAMGAGAAIATIAVGTRGFGDAVKDGGEALDKLAPSARRAAVELRSQALAWRAVQQVAQNRLFAGLDVQFRALGEKYLPVAATAAGGLAAELNRAADAFADFAVEADSVRDSQRGLELTRQAATRLAPVVKNLSAIFRDVSVVGAEEFPRLAINIELATDRWRRLVAEARNSGDLSRWIGDGIDQAAEFGRILGNTAGIFGAVATAADAAGIDVGGTLDRLTSQAERFLKSAPGQDGLVGFFNELREAGAALVPGLEAVGGAVASVLGHAADSGVLVEAARALSALAEGAAPVVETLGELTSTVLPPLLRLVGDLAPVLGPAAGAFLALKGGAGALSKIVTPAVAGLGGALGGSAVAGGAMAGAASTLISRIPVMGAVIAAAVGAVEALEISAEDAGRVVARGGEAADRMRRSYEENNNTLRAWLTLIPIAGTYLADLVDDQDDLAASTAEFERQQRNVNTATALADQQLKLYNDTVRTFGANSPQAVYAADQYKRAVGDLERAQSAAGLATDGHTLALSRQRDQFLGSEGAALQWAGSIDRATESVRINGRTVDINTEAGRNNRRALLDMASAAIADIEAKREHGASTEEITRLTDGHRRQLYDTAVQMGMSKDEAGRYVDQLNLTPASVNTTFTTPGLDAAIKGASELAGILRGLDGKSQVSINSAFDGARNAIDRAAGSRASGGPIHGPGSGTSDSILMRLSNGEFVQRASVVREQGMSRMAMLNAGMADIVPKSQVPGRATGGPVNRTIRLDFNGVAAQLQKKKDEMFPPMPMGVGGGGVGGGSARWAGVASQALALAGAPQSWLPLMLAQIQSESGGNPRAINLWDINAKRGTPSMGLLQTIMPTFNAHAGALRSRGPYDPLANLYAAVNYLRSRYGSPVGVWGRNRGYASGGVIPGAITGRDDKLVRAQAGERVLSRPQTQAFDRLVDHLDRPTPASPASLFGGGASGGGGTTVTNQFGDLHFREAIDIDLFSSRMDFAVRSASGFGG